MVMYFFQESLTIRTHAFLPYLKIPAMNSAFKHMMVAPHRSPQSSLCRKLDIFSSLTFINQEAIAPELVFSACTFCLAEGISHHSPSEGIVS